jgi:hypothetical protein
MALVLASRIAMPMGRIDSLSFGLLDVLVNHFNVLHLLIHLCNTLSGQLFSLKDHDILDVDANGAHEAQFEQRHV